jgi:xanthine dehydrogenase YagS FAD-binding subunit
MTLPAQTIEQPGAASPEYRAGGTDLQQRLRSGVSSGRLIDLHRLPGLRGISWDAGRAKIGALTPIADIARDAALSAAYPPLVQAAASLATPQIRAQATLAGNLLQRNRCWYFRHPAVSCYKKGGATCPARDGNHLFSSCFDLGPCVAPHPSTLGMALVAYEEAQFEVAERGMRPIAALYGDGSDARRDHQLKDGELVTAVLMPPPLPGEHGAYFRATSRASAEWPLAEALVRLALTGEKISFARVTVGAVAPIPLRRQEVEGALVGEPATAGTLARAARHSAHGAQPLPMTQYKVQLVCATVLEALQHALH